MKSLYAHIEEGNYRTPDIADGMLSWLDERLLHPDVLEALGSLLPDASSVDLAEVVLTISAAIRQP